MSSFVFGVIITLVAGFLDAVGFTYVSGLSLSFMSGNSTGLGVAIAQGRTGLVLASAAVVASFVLGAFAGALLVAVKGKKAPPIVLVMEAGLLVVSALLVDHVVQVVSLLPVGIAMGMQNAVPRYVAGVEVGRTYVTGALFGMGKALALSIGDLRHLPEAAALGSSWIALVVGAIGGSASLRLFGLTACLAIAVAAILLTVALDGFLWIKPSRAVVRE